MFNNYSSSNNFLDNCNFVNSLNVYVLKTRYYNRRINKFFILYNKSEKVLISNSIFSIFLLKRSLFFIIELVYNKGFVFIINTLFSDKSLKLIKKLIFFKYFTTISSISIINGFISNNFFLFKNLFEQQELKRSYLKYLITRKKKKSFQRIKKTSLKKGGLGKLVLSNLKIKKKIKKIRRILVKEFQNKYIEKAAKKVKMNAYKVYLKTKKFLKKLDFNLYLLSKKIINNLKSKHMPSIRLNNIIKKYLNRLRSILNNNNTDDKKYLINDVLLNKNILKFTSKKFIRSFFKRQTAKINRYNRINNKGSFEKRKINDISLFTKLYNQFYKKKYKEKYIYIRFIKNKRSKYKLGQIFNRFNRKNTLLNKFLLKNKKINSKFFNFLFRKIKSKYKILNLSKQIFENNFTIYKKFLKNKIFDDIFVILKEINKQIDSVKKIKYIYKLMLRRKIYLKKIVKKLNKNFVKYFKIFFSLYHNIYIYILKKIFNYKHFIKNLLVNLKKKNSKNKEELSRSILRILEVNNINLFNDLLIKIINNINFNFANQSLFSKLERKAQIILNFFNLKMNSLNVNVLIFDLRFLIVNLNSKINLINTFIKLYRKVFIKLIRIKIKNISLLYSIYLKRKNKNIQNIKKFKNFLTYNSSKNFRINYNFVNKKFRRYTDISNVKLNWNKSFLFKLSEINKQKNIKKYFFKSINKNIINKIERISQYKLIRKKRLSFFFYLYFKNELIKKFSLYFINIFNVFKHINKIQNIKIFDKFKKLNYLFFFDNRVNYFNQKIYKDLNFFFNEIINNYILSELFFCNKYKKLKSRSLFKNINNINILDLTDLIERITKRNNIKNLFINKKNENALVKLLNPLKFVSDSFEGSLSNFNFIKELLLILGLKKGLNNFLDVFLTKKFVKTINFKSLHFFLKFYKEKLLFLKDKGFNLFSNLNLYVNLLFRVLKIILVKIFKKILTQKNMSNLSENISKFFLLKIEDVPIKHFIHLFNKKNYNVKALRRRKKLQMENLETKKNERKDFITRRRISLHKSPEISKEIELFQEEEGVTFRSSSEVFKNIHLLDEKYKDETRLEIKEALKRKEMLTVTGDEYMSKFISQQKSKYNAHLADKREKLEAGVQENLRLAALAENLGIIINYNVQEKLVDEIKNYDKEIEIEEANKDILFLKKRFKGSLNNVKYTIFAALINNIGKEFNRIDFEDNTIKLYELQRSNFQYLLNIKNDSIYTEKFEDIYRLKIKNYVKDGYLFFKYIKFKFFIYFTFNTLKQIKENQKKDVEIHLNRFYLFNSLKVYKRMVFKGSFFNLFFSFPNTEKISAYNKKRYSRNLGRIRKKIRSPFSRINLSNFYLNNSYKNFIRNRLMSKLEIQKIKKINKIFSYLIKNSKYTLKNKFYFFDLFNKSKNILKLLKFFFKIKRVNMYSHNLIKTTGNRSFSDFGFSMKGQDNVDPFSTYVEARIPDSLIIFDLKLNIINTIRECEIINIPIIKFMDPSEINFVYDFPITIGINKKNQLFFLNFFLRVTFIGYKKFLFKLNSYSSFSI